MTVVFWGTAVTMVAAAILFLAVPIMRMEAASPALLGRTKSNSDE